LDHGLLLLDHRACAFLDLLFQDGIGLFQLGQQLCPKARDLAAYGG
jgi:hypothetical protein